MTHQPPPMRDGAWPAEAGSAGWTRAGWWRTAQKRLSRNHGVRPAGTKVDLMVVHSISLPPGEFGNGFVDDLFMNRLDPKRHPSFEGLRGLRVSAHFVVLRDGAVRQYVSCDRRAWHAGVSSHRGRPNCNDYSIGVELEGLEGDTFEAAQYTALAALWRACQQRYGLMHIAGHQHVAPGRKGDPGAGFDWMRFADLAALPDAALPPETLRKGAW